eukprot:Nk52_evm19s2578 gene=Nk52_evmTU19s2578
MGEFVYDPYMSATKVCEELRKGSLKCVHLLDLVYARIEKVNPKINAVVRLTKEEAYRRATELDDQFSKSGKTCGPLHGLPVSIKDNVQVTGYPTSVGNKAYTKEVSQANATVVQRLLDAGAIVVCKSNLPDHCMGFETDNLFTGFTCNPFDLNRTAGGSSGGEAALIASGCTFLGIGNDIGGSIRLPAQNCGIVGLRPTMGRVPITGIKPSFDNRIIPGLVGNTFTHGPMARYVEDIALVMPVIMGSDGFDSLIVDMPLSDYHKVDVKELKVAFPANAMQQGDLPCCEFVQDMLKGVQQFAKGGCASADFVAFPKINEVLNIMWSVLAFANMDTRNLLKNAGTDLHADVLQMLDHVESYIQGLTTSEVIQKINEWDILKHEVLKFMSNFDLLVLPASNTAALLKGEHFIDEEFFRYEAYAMYSPACGIPSMAVRADKFAKGGNGEGMPRGVEILAKKFEEHKVLAFAKELEKAGGIFKEPSSF